MSESADTPPRPAPPWSRLIACASAADALAEVASWFGDGIYALELRGTGEPVRWTAAAAPVDPVAPVVLTVEGDPPWRLAVCAAAGSCEPNTPERLAAALEAWRAARAELSAAESRLDHRTRELELIQALGHAAAEARTPRGLFAETVAALQHGGVLDLVLVAHALEGRREIVGFPTRPCSDQRMAQLARHVCEPLGWTPGDLPRPARVELDVYDEQRGERFDLRVEDLIVLPVLRRNTVVACLLVVPGVAPGAGRVRLLYSAANQLSLHLDRILTVREAEADRFRRILDSMPQAVLLSDVDLRIVQANRSARRIFGERQPADLIARPDLKSLIDRVRREEAPLAEGELRIGQRAFGVTVSPAAESGPDAGLVLVFNDVTESRRLQHQLAQSEKMSSLGQMISGVAHELNNPLTSILGYAQLLGRMSVEEKSRARLETLQREAERCQRIVQNLLSFARRREPEKRMLSLNEAVRSVHALMGYQLKADGIRLGTALSPELPALLGDLHQLQQLLVNLLTNAHHAIRHAERQGEIVLRTTVGANGSILLDVVDDGPGIAESVRERIFDPFVTTKEEGQGTGLGLALVSGIVADHGATIEAFNGERSGATFRIVFPGAPAAVVAAPASREDPGELAGVPGRILVVDDEDALARMICEVLAEDGHLAQVAHDGTEALDRLAGDDFELVISDLKMPGMSGERLFEEIRRKWPALSDRLLLTTGDTVSNEPERIVARTGLHLLRKPFDLERLRREVRRRLRPAASPGAGPRIAGAATAGVEDP